MVWLLFLPVVMLPLLPKIQGLALGGVVVLLDDLVLGTCVLCGLIGVVGRGAVTGSSKVTVCASAVALCYLVTFKATVLLVLGSFMRWTDFYGIGEGILFQEGILVLARLGTLCGVLLLSLQVFDTRRRVEIAVMLLLACAALVVCLGVAQFLLLDHKVLTSTFRPIDFIDRRFDGVENPWLGKTAAGHEHLAAFTVLAGSMVGGLLLTSWRKRPFSLQLLALGCVFVLVFSSSRGGWMGGVAALGCFFVVLALTGRLASGLRLASKLGLSLLVVWLFVDLDIGQYVDERIGNLLASLSGEIVDDSARHRIATLQYLWSVFLEYPLTGLGPGGAGRIAEGQFIRELVEGGVVGTSLFLTMIALVARTGYKCYRFGSDALTRGLGLGLLSGTAGLMTQSLFTELFVVVKVATPFWLLVGLAERSWILTRAKAMKAGLGTQGN